jgi:hypothetical protein
VQYYGSDLLDASLLMMPLVGFLPITDERVRGTVGAIERDLARKATIPSGASWLAISRRRSRFDPQPWLRPHETRCPPSEIYHFKPLDERVEVYSKPFQLVSGGHDSRHARSPEVAGDPDDGHHCRDDRLSGV